MQTLRIYWNFYPYWLDRIGKWKIISIFQSHCLSAFKYFRYFTNSTSRVSKFTVLYWALNWKIIPRIRLLIEPDINAISCIARLHFLQLQPVIETISHKKCICMDRKWFQGYSPKLFYSTGCSHHDLIIFWSYTYLWKRKLC